METFDVGIIGAGVAGTFATYRLINSHPKIKTLLVEMGRPPLKRRSQTLGWLGLLPNSDGKLFIDSFDYKGDSTIHNSFPKVSDIDLSLAMKEVYSYLSSVIDVNNYIQHNPNASLLKKLEKNGFKYLINKYLEIFPKEIHNLSKIISDKLEDSNITTIFDSEITSVERDGNEYIIHSSDEASYRCKKLLISVGRSGWRWANTIFKHFGLVGVETSCRYGIRVESDEAFFSGFKKSSITMSKNGVTYGPLCWNGTVIPEDHYDFAISAFRSNENRWKSSKVSFEMTSDIVQVNGVEQAERLGKLTFILTNDRIAKEKVSALELKKSRVSILKEYNWCAGAINEFGKMVPDVLSKGYFYVPTITTLPASLNINGKMMTELDGLYVAGESAGVSGLFGAMLSGILVADGIVGAL